MNSKTLFGYHPRYKKPIDHGVSNVDVSGVGFMSCGGQYGVSEIDEILSDHCPLKFTAKH
ncbi:hypothetical protein F0226_18870 [Vibrio sp. 99-70-13A1]|nr:hypothetical protein [Vibrio sp. 99-70-13A1]